MKKEGNVSKVAICPNCKGFILACHIDFMMIETEKEFTELEEEGFEIKEETIEETKSRKWSAYQDCINKNCKP